MAIWVEAIRSSSIAQSDMDKRYYSQHSMQTIHIRVFSVRNAHLVLQTVFLPAARETIHRINLYDLGFICEAI